MTPPAGARIKWIGYEEVLKIHDRAIERYGGLPGIRDENVARSAIARAQQLNAYTGTTDIAELASTMLWGIARSHPFSDANKRTSFGTVERFLEMNGMRIEYRIEDAIDFMISIARGDTDEKSAARWFRKRMRSL